MQLSNTQTNWISQQQNMRPMVQRAWLGVTGLALLPAIDLMNPYVDQETRNFSALRSAIYQMITMTSGLIVRYIAEEYAGKLFDQNRAHFLSEPYLKKVVNKSDDFRELLQNSKEFSRHFEGKVDFSKIDDWFQNPQVKNSLKQVLSGELKKKLVTACGLLGGIVSVFIIDFPFITKTLNFVSDKLTEYKDNIMDSKDKKKVSFNA